jgi:hypothetical protein
MDVAAEPPRDWKRSVTLSLLRAQTIPPCGVARFHGCPSPSTPGVSWGSPEFEEALRLRGGSLGIKEFCGTLELLTPRHPYATPETSQGRPTPLPGLFAPRRRPRRQPLSVRAASQCKSLM